MFKVIVADDNVDAAESLALLLPRATLTDRYATAAAVDDGHALYARGSAMLRSPGCDSADGPDAVS